MGKAVQAEESVQEYFDGLIKAGTQAEVRVLRRCVWAMAACCALCLALSHARAHTPPPHKQKLIAKIPPTKS